MTIDSPEERASRGTLTPEAALIQARAMTTGIYGRLRDLLDSYTKPCLDPCHHVHCPLLRDLHKVMADSRTEAVNAKELALDTSDPFTLLFGNACALIDQRDALKAAIAGCQQSFAWLVETQVNDSLVLYWHGEPGATTWAQDATKAARFPSRTAAEWAITVNKFYDRDVCGYPRPQAVEHGFIYAAPSETQAPLPMVLHCPNCKAQHIDAPQPATGWTNPPHRSHECQFCGCTWRPADVPTNGVASITTKGKKDWAL